MKLTFRYKGGSGSGHFGHSGRPGKVGGSTSTLSNMVPDTLPSWAQSLTDVKLVPNVSMTFEGKGIINAAMALEHSVKITGTTPVGTAFEGNYANSHLTGSVDHKNKTLILKAVHTDDSMRRKGLARAMIIYLHKYMKDNGYGDYRVITSGVYSPAGRAFAERMIEEGLLDS